MAREKTGAGFFEAFAGNEKWRRIAIAAGLAGIALIFLSALFNGGEKKQAENKPETQVLAQDYAATLEKSLTDLVTSIDGVGEAKVLVTLERDAEQIYATEEKKSTRTDGSEAENNDTETNYFLVKDADGTQHALKVTQVQPVVQGVVVVCSGGGNPLVQESITNAVTTALNITSLRVCVIKSKS